MLARRTLGSESEADDVAQEVFYRVVLVLLGVSGVKLVYDGALALL